MARFRLAAGVFALLVAAALPSGMAAGEAPPPPIATGVELTRLVLRDPDAPIAGNPQGDVTVVAFFDYLCGFCRRSMPKLAAFLGSDANVRVVFKDLPILGPASAMAARMAIAAKFQGRYRDAHDALLAAVPPPMTEAAAKAALGRAGLDIARLEGDLVAHSAAIEALLGRNKAEADALGIHTTPVFLIGPLDIAHEMTEDEFRKAVADARAWGPLADDEYRPEAPVR